MDEELEQFTELGCIRGSMIWGSFTVLALALGWYLWPVPHEEPSPYRLTATSAAVESARR